MMALLTLLTTLWCLATSVVVIVVVHAIPSAPTDHCVMGNDTYSIGEHWNPTLPPFGVMFCVHCECLSVERKLASKPEARVQCRNFKDDCPDVSTCPNGSPPSILAGRCCKACPGDDVFPFEKSVFRSTHRRLLKTLPIRPPPPPLRSEATTLSPRVSINVEPPMSPNSSGVTIDAGEQSDLPSNSITSSSNNINQLSSTVTASPSVAAPNNQSQISIQVSGPAAAHNLGRPASVKIYQNLTGVVIIIL